jgi:hypothetical protein
MNKQQSWREECMSYLREQYGAKGQEYIDEAEHGEGEGYWDTSFKTLDEVREDYELWIRG